MAEPDQPKKETVRIQMPPPSVTKPSQEVLKPHETVRIQLPVRETGVPPISSPPKSTSFFPVPKPPAAARPLSASVSALPVPSTSVPLQDTVRIPLMPEPSRPSQKKTQPLIAMPKAVSQDPQIAMAPAEQGSMRLYWMLLAMSALILIIQIWTYFS